MSKYKQTQKEGIPDSKRWAVKFQHQTFAKFCSAMNILRTGDPLVILPYVKSFASPEFNIQSLNSRFLYSTITISKLNC